jgi:hypothetical protein
MADTAGAEAAAAGVNGPLSNPLLVVPFSPATLSRPATEVYQQPPPAAAQYGGASQGDT